MELYAVYLTPEQWYTIVDHLHEGDKWDPLAQTILDTIGTIIEISPEYKRLRPSCGDCNHRSSCIIRAAVPSCPHFLERK